ncbi:MAG: sensor histidine kinase [Bryobacteraceae bacterium]|jgi:signal transduction histidine kinase
MKKKPIPQGEITEGSITRVLVIGFSLVIVLLVFGGSIALHNIISIQENAAKLVGEQRVTRHLIENLQDEQQTLSTVFYTIAGDPDTADADKISKRLAQADERLATLEKEARPTAAQQVLWGELLQASHAFGLEANRLLTENVSSPTGSRDLFRRHEQVIFIISQLVGQGFQRVAAAEREIDIRATRFNGQSLVLLCASLVLALVCSIFTVRMTHQLFRRMTWQESELTRVSWHMLAGQESIARRFSHELHDELGQTLAAVKSNLASSPRGSGDPAAERARRLEDSMRLVDDAIRNVRQLSQLLRPMILDDFGLDAGLAWLCEGFMQRTGIEVDYQSNLHSRLPDETETHLFRIAQEALTNVARHSGASKVIMTLRAEDDIRLIIVDNGKGIADLSAGTQSLGMTGMRARARAAGGVFRVVTPKEGGLKLEARIPLPEENVPSDRKEKHELHQNLAG